MLVIEHLVKIFKACNGHDLWVGQHLVLEMLDGFFVTFQGVLEELLQWDGKLGLFPIIGLFVKDIFPRVSKTFCVNGLIESEMLSPSAGWVSSPPSGSDGGMLVGLSGR